jgi:hypothetical protein
MKTLAHSLPALVLLAWLCGCGSTLDIHRPSLGASTPVPPLPASTISVPAVLDLAPLLSQVETLVPKEQQATADWTVIGRSPLGDLGLKYEAWREPLVLAVRDNGIGVESHLFYRFEVAQRIPKPIIGGSFWQALGSCGKGEPPREAVVGMRTTVTLSPDWQLVPSTAPVPTSFLNKCQVTFFKIDVTDRIGEQFDKGLRAAAGLADQRIRAQGNLRPLAERSWAQLQEPIMLDSNIWLTVNPESASASQPSGSGTVARVTAAFTAHPTIRFGPKPKIQARPLPPLGVTTPTDGFHMAVEGELSFEDATRQLQRLLRGTRQKIGGREVTITDIGLFGSGDMAVLQVSLAGDLDGTVYLAGHPTYDEKSGVLSIPDLDYSVETKETLVKIAEWLYHGSFRETVARQAKLALAQQLGEARRELQKGLNRRLAPNVMLAGTVTAVRPVGVYVTATSLRARVIIDGTLRVDLK